MNSMRIGYEHEKDSLQHRNHQNQIVLTMKESKITTRQACRMAWSIMPDRFTPLRFCNRVRAIVAPDFPMDGTILRRLRELREDHPEFNYRYAGGELAYYEKRRKQK